MNIFSINWWLSTFVSTLVTMIFIFFIKKMSARFNIPVVSEVVAAV